MSTGTAGIYRERGKPQSNNCGEWSIPATLGLPRGEEAAATADRENSRSAAGQGTSSPWRGRALSAQPCSPGIELQPLKRSPGNCFKFLQQPLYCHFIAFHEAAKPKLIQVTGLGWLQPAWPAPQERCWRGSRVCHFFTRRNAPAMIKIPFLLLSSVSFNVVVLFLSS